MINEYRKRKTFSTLQITFNVNCKQIQFVIMATLYCHKPVTKLMKGK